MFKRIIIIFAFLFLYNNQVAQAFKPETFVSIVHLVDGATPESLQNIKLTYQASTPSAIFNDWLLTTSVLNSSTVSGYFNDLLSQDQRQSVGLFLVPQKQPLDKMTIEERKAEIDTQFESFFSVFGFYPQVISASVIDTQSLNYLQKKYGLLSFVFLPGQHPEIPSNVGGFENAPYIASNKNFFLPSSSSQSRNSVVITEANYLNKNFLEFVDFVSQKKFNEFTQITFWTNPSEQKLEDISLLKKIYSELKSVSDKYSLNQKNIAAFSDWYLNRYPESTPAFYFTKNGEHTYQSPWYSISFTQTDETLTLKKLTVFDQNYADPSFVIPNPGTSGVQVLPQIDLSKISPISLNDNLFFSHLKNFEYWKMSLKNISQEIVLEPNRIKFVNIDPKIESNNLLTVTQKNNETLITFNYLNKSTRAYGTYLLLLIIGLTLYLFLKKKPPKHLVVGLALVLVANLVNVRSGTLFNFGLGFWGPHGHDAIFHLSLIEKFAQEPLSLSHPQISGQNITNYHLFFDYLSGLIVRFTGISSLDLYFRFFPIITGVLMVVLLDKVMNILRLSSLQKIYGFTLVFFGSSLGFVFRLFQNHDYLTGESAFWSNQSLSMFLNPPYLISVLFLLAFLILFSKTSKTKFTYLALIVLGGFLAQVKVYAFVLLCLALFFSKNFVLSFFVGLVGLIINLPFAKLGGSPFVFNPLWFPRSMFESADRVYLESIASAWQVFEATGQFGKVILLSLFALVVYLIGNLGVRVFGLYFTLKTKAINDTDHLLRYFVLFSLVLPLIVTQTVNPWNSIQFMYYGLFILGIYTAKSLPKNLIVAITIIALGIFGSFGTLRDYLTQNSSSRISHQELLALNKLKEQPKGIVLSPLHNQRSLLYAPVPLYDYISTAYVSALTGQSEYLSDTINLDITGINYQERSKNVQRFYNTTDQVWAKEFLLKENIRYIIETPLKQMRIAPASLGLEVVHQGGETNIYKLHSDQ